MARLLVFLTIFLNACLPGANNPSILDGRPHRPALGKKAPWAQPNNGGQDSALPKVPETGNSPIPGVPEPATNPGPVLPDSANSPSPNRPQPDPKGMPMPQPGPIAPGSADLEEFAVCALPLLYKNDLKSTDQNAKAFEDQLGGPEGVMKAVERMPKFACSLIYSSAAEAAKVNRANARIIMNLSPTPWKQVVPEYKHTDGKNYYDYTAGDMRNLLLDDNKEPVKNTLGTVQHEVGHIIVPLGRGPKWIGETFGDYIRLKAGFIDESRRKSDQSKHYCHGYNTGAFFFEWIEGKHPGFIKRFTSFLAAHSSGEWPGGYPQGDANSNEAFTTATGASLSSLWADYKASLGGINPAADCEAAFWKNY